MKIMENVVRLLLNLQFIFFLSGLHFNCPSFAYPSRHETRREYFKGQVQTKVSRSLAQHFKQMSQEQQNLSNVKSKRSKPVNVQCYPDHMEVVVNANLFEIGFLIDGNDLHLGAVEEGCRAVQSSANEFTLVAGLLDCGASRSVNENFLIYTNILVYSPQRAADGVVRMEEATIPVGCQFERKFSVSTDALQPTWIPYSASVVAEENFVFDLNIMTSDWLHQRGTTMYFLGGRINIEATVLVSHHTKMRVYINNCVATMGPDPSSLPRYEFIQDGCLVDSQLTGSTSQFMPRMSDDKLRFSIDAFRFHNQEGVEIFISCLLAAVPAAESADTQLKACSFINERWRSSEGHDLLCSRCQKYDGTDGSNPGAPSPVGKPYNTGFQKSSKLAKGWEQETALAPLLVFPGNPKSMPVNSRIPGQSDPRRQPLSSSKWKSRLDSEKTQKGNANEGSPMLPILHNGGKNAFTPEEDSNKDTPESISPEKETRDGQQEATVQRYGNALDETDAREPRSFKDLSSEGNEELEQVVLVSPTPDAIRMEDLSAEEKEGLRSGLLEISTPEPRNMDNFSPEENEDSRQGILDSLEDFNPEENESSGKEPFQEEETEGLGQETMRLNNSSSEIETNGFELGRGPQSVIPGLSLLPGDLQATPVNWAHEDHNPAYAHGDPATTQEFETPAATPGDEGILHWAQTASDLGHPTPTQDSYPSETAPGRNTDADITIDHTIKL